MAQSRVQKGKGKKSKFPMWGLAIVVVLVVAIAGYAIVRFSQASDQYYLKTILNGQLRGGVATVTKESNMTQNREIGNVPVYATFSSAEILGKNKACVYVVTQKSTSVTVELSGSYYPGKVLVQKSTMNYGSPESGWKEFCVNITTGYKDAVKFTESYTRYPVTSTLKISEDSPANTTSYATVNKMYLTN
jgi:hypothetical protein